jgi:arylsulfatase A-like enzyme
MGSELTRRDFLKLSALMGAMLPLYYYAKPADRRRWAESGQRPSLPNILILVFDTLSAKHISHYGYPRETMPNLARFAARANNYHAHYTAGNFTTPATASILTGTYPWTHRAFHLYGTVLDTFEQRNLFSSFAPLGYNIFSYTHNDLATLLLNQFSSSLDVFPGTRELCLFYENIYSDRLFPNDRNVAYMSEVELSQGMLNHYVPSSLFLSVFHEIWRFVRKNKLKDDYRQRFPRGLPSLNDTLAFFLLEDAIDWIQDQIVSIEQPYLGYIHVLPPHGPYTTRSEFIDVFDDGWTPVQKKEHFFSEGHPDRFLNKNRREYDEYILYADAEFGRLYDFIVQKGLDENTCIIVTSDHGEMFERGILAHNTSTLYEPIIRVPLLISQPGQRQSQDFHAPTSNVDLLPSLLTLANQNLPDWIEGRPLPGFADQGEDAGRSVFAVEAKSNPKQSPLTEATLAMVKDRYKLIRYLGYRGFENVSELYDLENDPEELEDLSAANKSLIEELQNELDDKLKAVDHEAA